MATNQAVVQAAVAQPFSDRAQRKIHEFKSTGIDVSAYPMITAGGTCRDIIMNDSDLTPLPSGGEGSSVE